MATQLGSVETSPRVSGGLTHALVTTCPWTFYARLFVVLPQRPLHWVTLCVHGPGISIVSLHLPPLVPRSVLPTLGVFGAPQYEACRLPPGRRPLASHAT